MSYTRFDRHENMTSETRDEIMDLIGETRHDILKNDLFGLFDGYLYGDILETAESELSKESFEKLQKIVEVVKTYPEIIVERR